jgi:hypothetical protein
MLFIYPYAFGLAPWEIYNLHSESLSYGQRNNMLQTLGAYKKVLYNWENPLKDQVLVLKKGIWSTEINLKLTDLIHEANWTQAIPTDTNPKKPPKEPEDSIKDTKIYWLSKVLNNQRSVVVTGDKELLKKLTEHDNPLTEVSLELTGIGLSIVKEVNNKEITYINVSRAYFSYIISMHNLRKFKFKAAALKIENGLEGDHYPVLLDQKRKKTDNFLNPFVNLSFEYRVKPNGTMCDIVCLVNIGNFTVRSHRSTCVKLFKQMEKLFEKTSNTIHCFGLTSSERETGERSYIKKFEINPFRIKCSVNYTFLIFKDVKIYVPRFKFENEFYQIHWLWEPIWYHYRRKIIEEQIFSRITRCYGKVKKLVKQTKTRLKKWYLHFFT